MNQVKINFYDELQSSTVSYLLHFNFFNFERNFDDNYNLVQCHNLLHFGFQLFFNFEHIPSGTVHTKEVYGAVGASQSTAASTLKPTPVLVSS